jgi:hypothetical protein
VIVGVVVFAAFFVRTQGLILLGSVLFFQGIRFLGQREQRNQLVIDTLIMVAIFGTLWGISMLIFPGGQTSYLALYSGFSVDSVVNNIISYSQLFSEFFATLPGQDLFFWIFVVFFFIGLVIHIKTDLLFVIYVALYLLVIWTWPEWQGYRFIFPMLPFFIYFAMQGIRGTLSRFGGENKVLLQMGAYAYLAIIVLFFTYNSGMYAYENLRANREINGPFDPLSLETFDFIRDETPPESVIIFFKPRAMRLMTDRYALALTECDRIPEGDYLVLSKKVGENLQIPPEQIDECNLPLKKVFENRRFIVYELLD